MGTRVVTDKRRVKGMVRDLMRGKVPMQEQLRTEKAEASRDGDSLQRVEGSSSEVSSLRKQAG